MSSAVQASYAVKAAAGQLASAYVAAKATKTASPGILSGALQFAARNPELTGAAVGAVGGAALPASGQTPTDRIKNRLRQALAGGLAGGSLGLGSRLLFSSGATTPTGPPPGQQAIDQFENQLSSIENTGTSSRPAMLAAGVGLANEGRIAYRDFLRPWLRPLHDPLKLDAIRHGLRNAGTVLPGLNPAPPRLPTTPSAIDQLIRMDPSALRQHLQPVMSARGPTTVFTPRGGSINLSKTDLQQLINAGAEAASKQQQAGMSGFQKFMQTPKGVGLGMLGRGSLYALPPLLYNWHQNNQNQQRLADFVNQQFQQQGL